MHRFGDAVSCKGPLCWKGFILGGDYRFGPSGILPARIRAAASCSRISMARSISPSSATLLTSLHATSHCCSSSTTTSRPTSFVTITTVGKSPRPVPLWPSLSLALSADSMIRPVSKANTKSGAREERFRVKRGTGVVKIISAL